MSTELHEGPLQPASSLPARRRFFAMRRQPAGRLTWREKRWERRRQRRRAEEVLGWILVPAILVGCFWAVKAGLNAFGTSPTAVLQGLKVITSGS